MNSAASVISTRGRKPPVLKYQIRQMKERPAALAFSMWPPGSLVAAEVTLPASLPKAITEPVKVIAPMKMPRKSSTRKKAISAGVFLAMSLAKVPRSSVLAADATFPISKWAMKPTKTAARPTSECIAATSCGISVICTFLAT
ncbi:hypothetical protein PHA8399_02460 [Leisingera aquaemixtae]|uniref:Uncharacterized protein n=1 Tax=Leisingera aquaemixtae TaxID=1396826 RepID=A0A0P1HXE1_9RHOB|nr:hypothetical protein PHA8399_02460 [Leisingera aquaemixtae]